MDIKELIKTDWYKSRPPVIKEAISKLPPSEMYRILPYNKECYIISYEEPISGNLEDVTVTVQKTGKGGLLESMGAGYLDMNKVFGLSLSDLEKVNT